MKKTNFISKVCLFLLYTKSSSTIIVRWWKLSTPNWLLLTLCWSLIFTYLIKIRSLIKTELTLCNFLKFCFNNVLIFHEKWKFRYHPQTRFEITSSRRDFCILRLMYSAATDAAPGYNDVDVRILRGGLL